ncbi:MAG: DsrE family protein [Deltaproteobacteria bacterium]|nr:DsrE family protein [Deltaproteobacteria bacterium]
MHKVAIILHAEPGTHDAMGRAAHALLYTKELKEAGVDVKLIFDGGGTRWVTELAKGDNPLNDMYKSVKEIGAISGVCQFCIGAFGGDVEDVKKTGLPLAGEYMGHPSLSSLIREGYQVITL